MTTKTYVIITLALTATGYAAGRWASPAKVVVETHTIEVEKKHEDTKTDTDKDKHKETTVTETTNPDGTKTKTTKTVEDTKTEKKTETTKTDDINKTTDSKTETTYATSKVTVSVLGGIPIALSGPVVPVYGASITRPILGPITIGAWALTSKVAGISLGLTF